MAGHRHTQGKITFKTFTKASQALSLKIQLSLDLERNDSASLRKQEIDLGLGFFRGSVEGRNSMLGAQLLLHILLCECSLILLAMDMSP